MRVLILNNDFRVYWKGRLLYLKQYLATENIELYAIELFGKGSPYTFDNYNNQESWWSCLFPNQSSGDLSAKEMQQKLFAVLDHIKPDVIIAPSIVFFAGALGLRWAKKNRKKFIMFDDIKPSQVKRNAVVQWVKDLLTSQADALWLPSAHYDLEYGVFKKRNTLLFYGFNCIDNNLFKSPVLKQLNHKNIICVARLVPIKNFESLLKAWRLVEKDSGYKLIIIGNGPLQTELISLKKELQLKNVDFLGAIDNDAIPDHYHHADALVLASLSESWGLVVNEAMAAGLPLLLSNKINAAVSLLEDGANGYLFDPATVSSIAEAIGKFIALDVSAKEAMSAKSLALVDTMTYEKMGTQLLDALAILNKQPFKKPGIIASTLINQWHGKYDTGVWDTL